MTISKYIISYVVLGILAIGLVFLLIFILSIPNVKNFKTCFTTSMYQVRFCEKNPNYVRFSRVPNVLIQSLLISEDASFYLHKGFDIDEIKTSLSDKVHGGKSLRGASTLSQQLIKNAFLTSDRSLLRKAIEAIGTYNLERSFTKNEILEFYLNIVEFGEGVYGLDAASKFYFAKHYSQLSLIESIFLVQLLPNPVARGRAFKQQEVTDATLSRMHGILSKLVEYNRLDEVVLSEAYIEFRLHPWLYSTSDDLDSEVSDTYEDLESIRSGW